MFKKFLAALAICAALAITANAVPITGQIDFTGAVTTDTGNLNTAHAFTSFSGVTVFNNPPATPTGSYAGTGGASVTMNSFSFNPFVAPVPNLWSFAFGGLTYTFNLTSITSIAQPGDNTLGVVGMGTAMITGGTSTYTPTAGQFFISTQGSNRTTFIFSSTTQSLPEGGSALALLGIGLVVVEVVRRKIATA